jgi:hypothetical protein
VNQARVLPLAARTADVHGCRCARTGCACLGGDEFRAGKVDAQRPALEATLLPHQRTDGAHAGSWDPIDVRGRYGGRVYATAVNLLSLEACHRFVRVLRAAVRPPAGGADKQRRCDAARCPNIRHTAVGTRCHVPPWRRRAGGSAE